MSANVSTVALKMTGQTTTTNSGDLDSISGSVGVFVVDITAFTGTTPTAVFLVEGKDPASGKYYTILQSAALVGVGTTILRVFPGGTPAANLIANDVVPRTFRVTCTIGGTTPALTATVGVILNGF